MKARKVYIWTKKQNNASIILQDKGVRIRYDFANGSVIQQIPATFITENEYYQRILEESELYQNGTIRIRQIIPLLSQEERIQKEKDMLESQKKSMTPVSGIKSAKSAMDWVANQLEEKATSGLKAVEIAKKHGYYFPDFQL